MPREPYSIEINEPEEREERDEFDNSDAFDELIRVAERVGFKEMAREMRNDIHTGTL